jgi:hypothetical protein
VFSRDERKGREVQCSMVAELAADDAIAGMSAEGRRPEKLIRAKALRERKAHHDRAEHALHHGIIGNRSSSSRAFNQTSGSASASEAPYEEPPLAYTSNSHKEALCLEFVKNFRKNFASVSQAHAARNLFLTCPNEFDVTKFVTTTVRPTQLPFREMYDYRKCAEFVAHFLDFEPLEKPTEPPPILPSSTQVLEWGVGDCFDFSILLASYLIGSGYDAYVVCGAGKEGREEGRMLLLR